MLKKIYKFCKITIQSSPLYFLLNLLMVFGIVFLQLGMSYMFKLMTNVVVNSGRNASTLEVALPIILFFFCITFGGNTGNFSNMMKNLYTQNAKKIFRKKFLEVAYQKKQDDFYDKEMYDQYEYVKNHIDETTQISEIIFNELLYRGYVVDVGVIEHRKMVDGKSEYKQYEVDFIATDGNEKYYIQSAYEIETEEKREQELNSLKRIDDSFQKIVIVKDDIMPYRDNNGILFTGLFQFLFSDKFV